jgi:hypothetical protein
MVVKQEINGCFALMMTIASHEALTKIELPTNYDESTQLKHVYSYLDLTELEEKEKKNFQGTYLETEKEKEKQSILDIRIDPKTYH